MGCILVRSGKSAVFYTCMVDAGRAIGVGRTTLWKWSKEKYKKWGEFEVYFEAEYSKSSQKKGRNGF